METLLDPTAGFGWKAAAVGSILLDATPVGWIPGTSTGTARGGAKVLDKAGDMLRGADNVAPKKATTVIGHLPDYPKVAEKMGANYLKPSANWNFQKQGKFVQDVISRGDDVFIGTKIRQGPSVLKKEIKQFYKAGYRPETPGSKLLIKE